MKNIINKRFAARQIITMPELGMEGIAIAKCIYLNGCVSYQVRTKGLKDGKIIEGEWIDEQQLTEESKAEAGGSGDVPSEFSHP